MRTRWLLVSIWVCFLFRGWFCASMFPLWEGYDEFSHFGVVRAIVEKGIQVVPRDQKGPRDVEESLRLAPVPWEVRKWPVFQSSLTEEAYWALRPEERQARATRLRDMPHAWQQEESAGGISAYEAYQTPLAYWLMAPLLYLMKGRSLLAQVMVLRWMGVVIASLAVPLAFDIGLTVAESLWPAESSIRERRQKGGSSRNCLPHFFALGCSAVIAVMPEFATNLARVSNEPLAILLFTLLVWLGLRILNRAPASVSAAALGLVLGLGLLTKAYFLTAVPAVFLLVLYKYRKAWTCALTVFVTTAAIAGWWYVRTVVTTGTVSGLAEPVMLQGKSAGSMLAGLPHVPWIRALDVILVSHLYFCGWSSLTVRSWMYHVFFVIVILAALGLTVQLRRPAVWWLVAVYGFFWLGQLYNVVLQYLTKGLAGSMGWYMYAVVACEVVLCGIAFGRYRIWMMALGTFLFGLLDLYGMHWLAIPYYTGIIGHRANGALAALHIGEFRAVGFGAVFARLAVNKWAVLSPGVLVVLWILYLLGTILPIVFMAWLALSSKAVNRVKPAAR